MTGNDRIAELLVREAIHGLSDSERSELESLLGVDTDVDRYAFQRATAGVFLAVAAASAEQMPFTLKSKLLHDAEQMHDENA